MKVSDGALSAALDELFEGKPNQRCQFMKAANLPTISIREPTLPAPAPSAPPIASKKKVTDPTSSNFEEDVVFIPKKEHSKSR